MHKCIYPEAVQGSMADTNACDICEHEKDCSEVGKLLPALDKEMAAFGLRFRRNDEEDEYQLFTPDSGEPKFAVQVAAAAIYSGRADMPMERWAKNFLLKELYEDFLKWQIKQESQ